MSRRKGKSFERWCASYFTNLTGLKWETTRNSGRTDLPGDIYCVDRPDLPVFVECKFRSAYTAHAMLKPTKAFSDMVKNNFIKLQYKYGYDYIIIIVKNDTGVWFCCASSDPKRPLTMHTYQYGTRLAVCGVQFMKLEHVVCFEIDGVIFDVKRTRETGETGKAG
jgi:hypothetical protein